VSGHYSGIAQGVLRVAADATDSYKRAQLRKAFLQMNKRYPGRTVYATLTANVILRSTVSASYSCFFGQSFGSGKAVFFGAKHDSVTGNVSKLFTEFALSERADLADLPINFTVEDFAGIYKRNFSKSEVVVDRVISLIYIFSIGLENYEREHTQSRTPIRLF
jgi:hypothetical protein